MLIEWLGHSSFLIVSSHGKKIITDPYQAGAYQGTFRYAPIRISADIVTVSHQHADHNGAAELPNHFEIVSRAEEHTLHGIKIKGVKSAHDDQAGTVKGANVIFVIEIDGMRVCHLGDLGHVLNAQQVEQIGHVDVLLIPVGGYYTIGPSQADQVIKQLKPKIAIPMHYKTDKVDFPIMPVSEFIRDKDNVQIREGSKFETLKEQLPDETIIIVLQHAL